MKTVGEALGVLRQIWREAAGFFLSIELWMMVLLSWATVAGYWLAYVGDLRCLLVFAAALAYIVVRVTLHLKRILHWPFI